MVLEGGPWDGREVPVESGWPPPDGFKNKAFSGGWYYRIGETLRYEWRRDSPGQEVGVVGDGGAG